MSKDFPDWTTNLSYAESRIAQIGVPAGGFFQEFDISSFSTVTISAVNPLGTFFVVLNFVDALGQVVGQQVVSSPNGDNVGISFPVTSARLDVAVTAASAFTQITLTGSNRQSSAPRSMRSTWVPRGFTLSGVWVANTARQLLAVDGGVNSTSFYGPCTLSVQTLGVAGVIFGEWIAANGSVNFAAFTSDIAVGGISVSLIAHPISGMIWFFRPDAAAAAATVSLQITPSEA